MQPWRGGINLIFIVTLAVTLACLRAGLPSIPRVSQGDSRDPGRTLPFFDRPEQSHLAKGRTENLQLRPECSAKYSERSSPPISEDGKQRTAFCEPHAAFRLSILPPGSFDARTSTFSMIGGLARSSGAFAISAAATLPARCACRPASSGKASKIPNVVGPIRIPNQASVPGSSWTIGRPPFRKASTSASFPGLASNRTYNATVTVVCLLVWRNSLREIVTPRRTRIQQAPAHRLSRLPEQHVLMGMFRSARMGTGEVRPKSYAHDEPRSIGGIIQLGYGLSCCFRAVSRSVRSAPCGANRGKRGYHHSRTCR